MVLTCGALPHAHDQCLHGAFRSLHLAYAATSCTTQAAGCLRVRCRPRNSVVASLPNSPSCSFSLSSRAWACINAALWFMVSTLCLSRVCHASTFEQVAARTDVSPWNAPYAYCICLAPLAITYALYTLSNNVVKFDRSIDDLEGTKYEFKKL
jgi:hypothetical protein